MPDNNRMVSQAVPDNNRIVGQAMPDNNRMVGQAVPDNTIIRRQCDISLPGVSGGLSFCVWQESTFSAFRPPPSIVIIQHPSFNPPIPQSLLYKCAS